jgi:hypothetical protein
MTLPKLTPIPPQPSPQRALPATFTPSPPLPIQVVQSINNLSNLPAQPNLKLQTGRFTVSFAATSSQAGTQTFPTAFSVGSNPLVFLMMEVGANFDLNLNLTAQPTNTSFAWRWFQNTGVAVTGSAAIHWLAIGQ